MTPLVVFTIGHSTRATEAFIRLLSFFGQDNRYGHRVYAGLVTDAKPR